MPNRNYRRGVYKERKVVNKAREKGKIALRSAGSHSKIDVVVIDTKKKLIKFYQCKPKSMSKNAKQKLEDELSILNNEYLCSFEVI